MDMIEDTKLTDKKINIDGMSADGIRFRIQCTQPRVYNVVEDVTDNVAGPSMKKKRKFTWSPTHDEMLLKEVLIEEPYLVKKYTIKRKKAWDRIAENLNLLFVPTGFKYLTGRGCNERFMVMKEKYERKRKEEERTMGILIQNEQTTRLEDMLSDVLEREAGELMRRNTEKVRRIENERMQVEEMRERSMERMVETTVRRMRDEREDHSGEGSGKEKGRKRKAGGIVGADGFDAVEYLIKKAEEEGEIKRKELQLKETELEIRRKEIEVREKDLQAHKEQMERSFNNIEAILQMQQTLMDKLINKFP